MSEPTAPAPPDTRRRILEAAFLEFYRSGFWGGSLRAVAEATGVTKGALFHYFPDKRALGYAVVDEVVGPILMTRWLGPVREAEDPVDAIQACFRRYIREDIGTGHWVLGCPLNNLAQEMSPLDDGFRERIDALYGAWRSGFAAALETGKERGSVAAATDAHGTAAMIVALQMGIWGTGKASRDEALMVQAGESLCAWLETLRTERS